MMFGVKTTFRFEFAVFLTVEFAKLGFSDVLDFGDDLATVVGFAFGDLVGFDSFFVSFFAVVSFFIGFFYVFWLGKLLEKSSELSG